MTILYIYCMTYKVYKLSDPRDCTIKYVGLTKNSIHQRLASHIYESYTRRRVLDMKGPWLRELFELGMFPLVQIIEQTTDKSREVFWIHKLKPELNLISTRNSALFEQRGRVNAQVIYQYSLEGKFIMTWKSGMEAERKLNIESGNISACVMGRRKQAGGFIWKKHKTEKVPFYQRISFTKEIHMYSLEGKYIKSFNSARKAAEEGFSYKKISSCCLGRNQTHAGFKFSFTKVEDIVRSSEKSETLV